MENGQDKSDESLRHIIEEQATKIKDKVADVDWEKIPEEVTTYVRSKPLKSLAVALGLGFLVGFIFKSKKGD